MSSELPCPCPLCGAVEVRELFSKARSFFRCSTCDLSFVSRNEIPNLETARKRYLLHENSIEHKGYCNFLMRLVGPLSEMLESAAQGLDFGCGPGPTLSLLMAERGFSVQNYDPIFFPQTQLLARDYDFLTATEVVEHFAQPDKEISLMLSLLKPQGVLALMTEICSDELSFENWHYALDPTHVAFYSASTMERIAKKNSLEMFTPHKNVRIFRKP